MADDDCLFCRLYREGDHVAASDGFVAIRDLHPQAETHLLVIPERHVAGFHDIAETARDQGLEDYRVVVNAGAGAGQTIFHLHWHILSGRLTGRMA